MTKKQIEKKAEEIKAKIEDVANDYALDYDGREFDIAYDAFCDGAVWLLSHQWVSVEDELPPKGEIVIAHYETADEIGETFATHDGTNWGDGGEYFEDDSVTHWMPIPPIAEEGGTK